MFYIAIADFFQHISLNYFLCKNTYQNLCLQNIFFRKKLTRFKLTSHHMCSVRKGVLENFGKSLQTKVARIDSMLTYLDSSLEQRT